jgi:HAD superfamily hydrolase (TIGR01509 family)
MSAKADLVIFDCDGVLIDSEPMAARAVSDELALWDLDLPPAEIARRFAGWTDGHIAMFLREERGSRLPEDFPARVAQRALSLFEEELAAMPGAAELLARHQGARCVASNSGRARLRRALEIVGLLGAFAPDALFSAEQVARPKPSPDLPRLAARSMGCAAQHCLVIEDSASGVRAARAAGMRVVGFIGGSHVAPDHGQALAEAGASAVVKDFAELTGLLKQEGLL